MKKLFVSLLCVVIAASSMSVNAKNWRVFTDLNLGYGLSFVELDEKEYSFGGMLLASTGYQNNKMFIGCGTGFILSGETQSLPIYAQFRYDFFKIDPMAFTPFKSLRAGYSLATSDDAESGIFANPTIGLRKGISETVGLNIGLSYSIYGKTAYYYDKEEIDGNINAWGIFFNIGLDF